MTKTGYTVLGWLVWRIGSRVARRKLAENRAKIGAGALVALAIVVGVAAARAGDDE